MIKYDDFAESARWAGFDKPRETAFTYDGPNGPGEYNWYYAKWKLRDFPSECVNPDWLLSYYEDPQDEANSFACFEIDGATRKLSLVHSFSELVSMLEPYSKELEGYLEEHADEAIGWIDRRLFEAAISAPDLFGHVTNKGLRADLAAISSHRFASIGWEGKEKEAYKAVDFLKAAGFALPEWFESGGIRRVIPSFLKTENIEYTIIENHSADGDLPWLSLSIFTKTGNPIYPLIETSVPLAARDMPSADGLGLYESLVSGFYQFDLDAPSWRIWDERSGIVKSRFDSDMTLDEAWDDCITDSMQVLREEYERQDKGEER